MGRKNSTRNKKIRGTVPQNILQGTLDITRSGMGFVIISNANSDIMVSPTDFNTAMHGDTVKVKLISSNGKRLKGEITEVVERKRVQFVGRIQLSKDFAFFIADMERPMPDLYIPLGSLNGAQNGERVLVKLTKWEKNGKKPVGEVLSILAGENQNDAVMNEIILDAGFPLGFSDDVQEAASRLPDNITDEEAGLRKDMRGIATITIDPADAKDFDDAISYQKITATTFEIGVHIADVSHYVTPKDVLDAAAYEKATSVYLPDRVNPMLPEQISNTLCSLRPNEDKLAFSAIFTINTKAQIKNIWLGKTVIHSNRRFTYEEAQEIIENKEGERAEEILLLNSLAQKLRKKRFESGAINFSSQEVRFQLNENGDPIGVVIKESKEAHQLVEEFMLLANKAVAEFVAQKQINGKPVPFPYRIHDTPDEEKLLPFIAFAKKFGHKFDTESPEEISKSFNKMLSEAQGKPEQHVLEQLGIRTMAKAKYTSENIGHYGLGFEKYCHFTSPIRRYPDVLVHRILYQLLQAEGNLGFDKHLEEKCVHCSERERAAMEAERKATKYKQVQYLSKFLGEQFLGVVSGVASFGFWVETVEHKCEGLVSVQSLIDFDEFRHVETEYCLIGRRSNKKIRIGDKLTIQVAAANLDKRQLDFVWIMDKEDPETPPVKKTRKPQKESNQ